MKDIKELGMEPFPWRLDERNYVTSILGSNGNPVFQGRDVSVSNGVLNMFVASAGLYECLKEAVADKCEQCKNSWYGKCVTADGKPCAVVAKWMDALKKAVGEG